MNENTNRDMAMVLTECSRTGNYEDFVTGIGLEKFIPLIPFSREEVIDALTTTGEALKIWDSAAGFVENRTTGHITEYGAAIKNLLFLYGVKSTAPSTRVCLLKTAARMWASPQQ